MFLDFFQKNTIKCFAISSPGSFREVNEDNIYVDGTFLPQDKTVDMELSAVDGYSHTFAVCDGIGGADCGEVASAIAVKEICRYEKCGHFDCADCIDLANAAIVNEKKKRHVSGMGSTVAIVHIEGDTAYFANVGDSRIYMFRDGNLKQISKDHTRIQMMIDSGIEQDKLIPEALHKLTQNLGIHPDDFVINPYFDTCEIIKDDVILLCSDGITDELSDNELKSLMIDMKDSAAENIARSILNSANERAGKDNLSVVIYKH